jgi:hypothetical protein
MFALKTRAMELHLENGRLENAHTHNLDAGGVKLVARYFKGIFSADV